MLAFLLIIGHLIGDFVLQTSRMATEKQQNFSKLLQHCGIYTVVIFIILFISSKHVDAVWISLIIGISHFMIDFFRNHADKKCNDRISVFLFFIDQILHIGICIIVVWYFNLKIEMNTPIGLMVKTFGEINTRNSIIYVLLYLSMCQPAAVAIKKILLYIENQENMKPDSNDVTTYNAGYIIGILERVIITTLVLQNEVSTIGFVLAAKSLARYQQLDQQKFAEKYLVGTLGSVVIAIIVTLVLKNMLVSVS